MRKVSHWHGSSAQKAEELSFGDIEQRWAQFYCYWR